MNILNGITINAAKRANLIISIKKFSCLEEDVSCVDVSEFMSRQYSINYAINQEIRQNICTQLDSANSKQCTTIENMYYCIGLGNPGKEYEQTPHNIGLSLLKEFHKENEHYFGEIKEEQQFKRHVSAGKMCEQGITLIFPDTFMNTSGVCVSDLQHEDAEKLVVLYDDIDLPFGEVRISFDRGDGGHNGIKSIEKSLDTRKFIRLRIGVSPTDWFGNPRKPKGRDAVSNYLTKKKLSKKYAMQTPEILQRVEDAIICLAKEGRAKAMNKIN